MIKIAVDAMGGDHAPNITVQGAELALKTFNDIEIALFGDENLIRPLIATSNERLHIVHCDDYFRMDETDLAFAVRKRKDASLIKAMTLTREGEYDAVVSAGPTAAVVSGGTLVVKRIPGFHRPALGPLIPQVDGSWMLLLDSGANAECRPEWLLQFAQIGSIFQERVNGINNPRVGLLNNGEEEGKGRPIDIETYDLLKHSNLNFIGNVEGKDIINGVCDVLVTDGFTGNIALKTMEGVANGFGTILKEALKSSALGMLGGLLAKKNLNQIKTRFDASEVGGAVLFGTNAVVIKAHGSSDAKALMNAIRQARETVKQNVIPTIKEVIAEMKKEEKVEV